MNNTRRKALQSIIDKLDDLKFDIEILQEEEEDYRDNIPENLQGSERYEKAEEACDNLDSAVYSLEEVIDYITSAID